MSSRRIITLTGCTTSDRDFLCGGTSDVSLSAPRRFCAPSFLRPVVSAPRRFCAPALLLLTLALVSLALTASPAAAGSYSAPTFDGGYWTFDDTPLQYPFPQANPYAGDHEDANFCGGDLTATSTWTPDNSADTAPQVIVTQIVDAYWDVRGVNGYPKASCTDGLFGDKEVDMPYMEGYYSGDSGRTNYSLQSPSGNNVQVTCSAVSATLDYNSTTPPVDDGDVGASWEVDLSPVTIALIGPIQDSSGNYNILVGQKCTASLSGIPTALLPYTTYQWKVSNSASTFQSWAVVSDPKSQSHTAESDGPGPLTNPTASWFWDELKTKSETITCTATVTPPTGQGAAFPVTVTQAVNVVVPGWTGIGTGGTMQVNTALNGANGNYYLYAGPTDTSTPGRGMEWKATLSPLPAPFSGTGALELVQTETPNLTYTSSAGVVYNRSNNGQQGLDTSYDYGWDQPSTAPTYTGGDSPNIILTGVTSAQLDYSFVDTLMYEPPGSSQYVSLATFTWSTNGSAQLPGTKNWKDYGSGSAGTLTPTGPNNFTSSIAFPSWPQNDGVGWTWVAAKK